MISLAELATHLRNWSEWRFEMGDDHPDDPRHHEAAEALAELAADLTDLENSKAHRALVAAWEKVAGSPHLGEAEEAIARTVGFSVLPTAQEFLRALVDRIEQQAAAAG